MTAAPPPPHTKAHTPSPPPKPLWHLQCTQSVVHPSWSFSLAQNDIALCFLNGTSRFPPIALAGGEGPLVLLLLLLLRCRLCSYPPAYPSYTPPHALWVAEEWRLVRLMAALHAMQVAPRSALPVISQSWAGAAPQREVPRVQTC